MLDFGREAAKAVTEVHLRVTGPTIGYHSTGLPMMIHEGIHSSGLVSSPSNVFFFDLAESFQRSIVSW
jgi:hypothetical protein